MNFNSLWSNPAIWQQWSWSTLAQVMAWCLMASRGIKPLWNATKIVLWQFHQCSWTESATYVQRLNFWNYCHISCGNKYVTDFSLKIELRFSFSNWKTLHVLFPVFSALETLSHHCKQLKTLDVGWCKNITDAGVRQIAENSPNLTYLGLMRCDQVGKSAL